MKTIQVKRIEPGNVVYNVLLNLNHVCFAIPNKDNATQSIVALSNGVVMVVGIAYDKLKTEMNK